MKNHNTNKTNFLVTIAGPTAVGKTESTILLAKQFNAEVFSADSRQLYKELNIGTAKPSKEELASAKHHFIDHVSVTETYNAGKYERDFDILSSEYFSNNKIGILTGGTGMYLRAALEGLDKFPDVSQEIKDKYHQLYTEQGIEALQDLLKSKDSEYAQSADMNNLRRISRALEVMEAGNQTYSSYLNQREPKVNNFKPIKICLTRDREELYSRINLRVDSMMKAGLLEEVKSLISFKNNPSLQTVGYSELFQYLDGAISLDEAVELIKRNSRRYAKRQMTWFRNQGNWHMIEAHDIDSLVAHITDQMKMI